ncbi:MAG: hypothetical protein GXO48_02730 [Chlorobi bacterium]|nr:hypothetical protein [Chlorobiota bacterium]
MVLFLRLELFLMGFVWLWTGFVFGQSSVLHFVQESSRSVSESVSGIFNFGSRQLLVNMQRRRVSFTLLDSVGKPVRSGFIALPGDMRLTSGAKTDSGVIIALGAPTMSPSFIVRVDTSLNIVWAKKIEDPVYGPGASPTIQSIYVKQDTIFLAGVNYYRWDSVYLAALKLDGTLLWQRHYNYTVATAMYYTPALGFNYLKNELIISIGDVILYVNPTNGVPDTAYLSPFPVVRIAPTRYGDLYFLMAGNSSVDQVLIRSRDTTVIKTIGLQFSAANTRMIDVKVSKGVVWLSGTAERTFEEDASLMLTDTALNNFSFYFVGKPGATESEAVVDVDTSDGSVWLSSSSYDYTLGGGSIVGHFAPGNVSYRCYVTEGVLDTVEMQISFTGAVNPPFSVPPFQFVDTTLSMVPDSMFISCLCPIEAGYVTTAEPYVCTEIDSVNFLYTGDTVNVLWYEWFLGSGSTPSVDSSLNPSGVVFDSAGFISVRLRVSDVACLTEVNIPVVVHQSPNASFIMSTDTVCEEEPVDFQNTGSTGNWTYSWDFGADASPRTSFDSVPSAIIWTSPGQKRILLTISDQYCSRTAVDTVTVLDKPEADFFFPVQACQYDSVSVEFSGSAMPGVAFLWSYENALPSTGTGTNDTTTFLYTGWQEIQLIVTNPNGCADTASQFIRIDTSPVVSFTSTGPVCAGQPIDFFNTGTTGGSWVYQWYFGSAAVPSSSPHENPTGVVFNRGDTFTVYLTIRNVMTGCESTDSGSVVVWGLPVAEAGPDDTTICYGTGVLLGGDSVPGYSYLWGPAVLVSDTGVANPRGYPVEPRTVFSVVVIDSNGCESRDSVVVYMREPLVVDAGPDVDLCYGDSVVLRASFYYSVRYRWGPFYGLSDSLGMEVVAFPDSSVVYWVEIEDTSVYRCGVARDEVVVRVHPLPELEIVPRGDTIARGESLELVVTGASEYEWSPDYGIDNVHVSNPVVSPDSSVMYVVRGVDVYGCEGYDSVWVYVREPDVWVPRSFSPNGDGLNDGVKVLGYGFVEYELWIYDRFGGLMFHSQDTEERWYGESPGSGEPAPEGAYTYYFRGRLSDGREIVKQGVINLVR